jgi:MT0933-like antitoxin protein
MGIFDKAKDLAAKHSDAISGGIDKAADIADQRTGGKHAERIDQGSETVKDRVGDYLGRDQETEPPADYVAPDPQAEPSAPDRVTRDPEARPPV